jgi:hypothetical protein
MGYFEGIVSAVFKKDAGGNVIYFPYGVLGKGRVLPDEAAEQEVRDFVMWYYKSSLIGSFVFVVVSGYGGYQTFMSLLTVASVFAAWLYFRINSLVSKYPYSNEKLSVKNAYWNSAKAHNTSTLWFMFIICLLFVMPALVALIYGVWTKSATPIGFYVMTIMLFGSFSLAFGYMLWLKRAKRASSKP